MRRVVTRSTALLLGVFSLTLSAQEAAEPAAGEQDEQRLFVLEDSLNTSLEIASHTAQTEEEAPSIVSVVTRQQIDAYGARDITDILRAVPGFEFGIDVGSNLGLMSRGIWVHEGKALVMINGLPMNDWAYGNVEYFGSMPASMIERVEILRGPGSALYGGFAEVATINIITRKGADLKGARLEAAFGAMGHANWTRKAELSAGTKVGDVELSASVGYNYTPLSIRTYQDFYGNSLQMGSANSYRQWDHVVVQAAVKGLSLSFKQNNMNYLAQDSYTTIVPVTADGLRSEQTSNTLEGFQLKYDAKPSERLKITPLVEFNRGNPVNTAVYAAGVSFGQWSNDSAVMVRGRAEISGSYDIAGAGKAEAGVGYLRDSVRNVSSTNAPGLQLSTDPANTAFSTYSDSKYIYGQYAQQLRPVGLGVTVGARYESTTFGAAFAPRAGVTYVHDKFNAKLLFGRAFRTPMPWQVYSRIESFPGSLSPETTNTYEVELGYRLTEHLRAKANGYIINVYSPLVYLGSTNSYQNFGHVQSLGGEAELNAAFPNFGGYLNLSYFHPGSSTSDGFLSKDRSEFLGMAPFKANLGAYYRWGHLQLGPSATFLSPRRGQSPAFANNLTNGAYDDTTYPSVLLVNANLRVTDVLHGWASGVDVYFTVHNLFNANYLLLQPYYGAHAPFPVNDREADVGLVWTL